MHIIIKTITKTKTIIMKLLTRIMIIKLLILYNYNEIINHNVININNKFE